MRQHTFRGSFLALFSAFALAACGGGGGTTPDAGPSSTDGGSVADAATAPIAACQAAADSYLALCRSVETDPGRRCEIERYRDACDGGDADAIAGIYACLEENRSAGGVCATFSDLATTEVRACAWEAVGTTPRASATAARDAYCAICDGASVCIDARTDSAPQAWDLFSDAVNAALVDCFGAAADCDTASRCISETPLAPCL